MAGKSQGQEDLVEVSQPGVGFGLERLGIIALGFPKCALVLVVLATIGLSFAATQLTFSSEIREVFRSDQSEFELLETMTSQYPGNERTIFVLVQGEIGFHKSGLEPLQRVHSELSWLEGVQKVLSAFSVLRRSPDGGTEPLIGPDLENAPGADALKRSVVSHPLVKRMLVAKDADAMLFLVVLDDKNWSLPQLEGALIALRSTLDKALSRTGLTYDLAGLPMIRNEIIGALKHDQAIFKIVGLFLGAAITWLFFRSLRCVVVTVVPSAVAVIWLLGLQALIGLEITVLNNVVPVLVMVIAFADSLHLVFTIRRKLSAGAPPQDAIAQAVHEVGPACALTSLTTAICIGTLAFLPQSFLSGFGVLAALGTAFAFVATMVTLPPLARLVLTADRSRSEPNLTAPNTVDALSHGLSAVSFGRPGTVTAAAVCMLVITAICYHSTEPRYLYRDHLPLNSSVEKVTQEIDANFSGVAEIRVFMQWPNGQNLLAGEVLSAVRAVHEWLAKEPEINSVRSLVSLKDIIDGAAQPPAQDPAEHIFGAVTPQTFALHYAREMGVALAGHSSTLVVGQTLDLPASKLLPFMQRLQGVLGEVERDHPGLQADPTGIAPVAASMSTQMINQLNRSLLLAIVMVVVLIGVMFRSVQAAAVAIMPNLLPLTIAGTYLFFSGKGLQFTSVVAFTVGFGIAVDNTIHLLNRYRIERAALPDLEQALRETMNKIGPVLVTGTLVLIAGLGATLASSMPMVNLFGQITVLVLAVALVASILLFPTQILLLNRVAVQQS